MASTSTPRILLLGGHGKIALHLTPLLLARQWSVTSVIRNPAHEAEIRALAPENSAGQLDVLVESLEEVKKPEDAHKVLEKTKADWVIWLAGAGGKGGAERTFAVDRDAAKAYIAASATTPRVTKFLMVSYIASRRTRAPWWSDADWASAREVNEGVLKNYHAAKIDADELLVAHAHKRGGDWQAINLRPGTLTDDPKTGKVQLGRTGSRGKITREDVAEVAVRLLERDDTRGYYDLLQGDVDTDSAVKRVAEERIDSFMGEDEERIYALVP